MFGQCAFNDLIYSGQLWLVKNYNLGNRYTGISGTSCLLMDSSFEIYIAISGSNFLLAR